MRLTLLLLCQCCVLSANPLAKAPWDLETVFNASPYAFFGLVKSVEVMPEVKTGVMGVEASQISEDEPVLEEIVWNDVRLYTFTIIDSFKGELAGEVEIYAPAESGHLWSYFETDLGDRIISKMAEPDTYASKLSVGESGLFFVNAFNGSTLPMLVALRSEDHAERGLRILQTYKQTDGVSLSAVIELDDSMQAATDEQKAAQLAELEKRYHKMLMILDYQERKTALEQFIAELGYEHLWSIEDFQAKHSDSFGMYIEEGRVRPAPTRPESGKERLWYECTKEIEKIDTILKARGKE